MRDIITRVYVYTYLLLLMVFYFSDAHAGGFETKGMGSRQLSMGGAALGLADDWSAIYWNPAGLAHLKGSELVVEAHAMVIHQDSSKSLRNISLIEFSNQSPDTRNQNFLKGDSVKFYDEEPDFYKNQNLDSILPSPVLAWYMNFGDFTFATGFYGSSGGGVSWEDNLNNFKGKDSISSKINLAFFTANLPLTFSYKFNHKFSLGTNVSFVYGYNSRKVSKNYLSPEDDKKNKTFLNKSKSYGYGVSLSLGVLYKFNQQFSMGAIAFAPYTIYGKGETEFKSFVNEKSDNETESAQPFKAGIGLAFKPNPHLKFALDGYYVMHSAIEVKTTYKNPANLLNDNTVSWGMEDTLMARFGAEYTDLEPFSLRAGFIYDPSPFKNERASLTTPRYTDVYAPTLGLGFKLEKFRMDMAYQFAYSPNRKVKYEDAYSYETAPQEKPESLKINAYSHILTATGIYRF